MIEIFPKYKWRTLCLNGEKIKASQMRLINVTEWTLWNMKIIKDFPTNINSFSNVKICLLSLLINHHPAFSVTKRLEIHSQRGSKWNLIIVMFKTCQPLLSKCHAALKKYFRQQFSGNSIKCCNFNFTLPLSIFRKGCR